MSRVKTFVVGMICTRSSARRSAGAVRASVRIQRRVPCSNGWPPPWLKQPKVWLPRVQYTFPSMQRSPMRVYFPVIVTNAELKVCSYEKSELDLPTGTLKSAEIESAQFVRFRKQVGAMPSELPKRGAVFDPSLVARAKESTVFIVNVNHVQHFLRYFEVYDQQLRQIYESAGR